MSWHEGTLYGFDVESTGVDVFTDRIVTATVVKIEGGQLADQRSWLVDPGISIPEAATKVHGITTERARAEEPYFHEQGPIALHTLQKTWRREQMRGLREYFDKNGTDHDGCDGGWPLHTRLLEAVPA